MKNIWNTSYAHTFGLLIVVSFMCLVLISFSSVQYVCPFFAFFFRQRFTGWSAEIHEALEATSNNDVEQRDLYDRAPSVRLCAARYLKNKIMAALRASGWCRGLECALLPYVFWICDRSIRIWHVYRWRQISAVQYGTTQPWGSFWERKSQLKTRISRTSMCVAATVCCRCVRKNSNV